MNKGSVSCEIQRNKSFKYKWPNPFDDERAMYNKTKSLLKQSNDCRSYVAKIPAISRKFVENITSLPVLESKKVSTEPSSGTKRKMNVKSFQAA
jgi:hypothetical protein